MAVSWDNLSIGSPSMNHSNRFFDRRHLEHEKMADLALKNLLLSKGSARSQRSHKSLSSITENAENMSLNDILEETVSSMKNLVVAKKREPLKAINVRKTQPAAVSSNAAKKTGPPVPLKEPFKPFKARPVPKYLMQKRAQAEENKENTAPKPQNAPQPASKAGAAKKPAPRQVLAPRKVGIPVKTQPKPASKVLREVPVGSQPKYVTAAEVLARKTLPAKRHSRGLRISTSAPAVPGRISQPRRSAPATKLPKAVPEVKRKFTATVPKYLHKEPFRAKLGEAKKPPTETKPFKVPEGRFKFEHERRKAQEDKSRKMREEQQKREQEELKQLRKMREFKAKPNPFSKVVKKKADV